MYKNKAKYTFNSQKPNQKYVKENIIKIKNRPQDASFNIILGKKQNYCFKA